jgi:hypothetical protein
MKRDGQDPTHGKIRKENKQISNTMKKKKNLEGRKDDK